MIENRMTEMTADTGKTGKRPDSSWPDGVLNIYKEKGYTSFDVVAKLRGILHVKKIGHTGTLDPAAEGVLPVCLGTATHLCDMLTDKSKVYRAVMLLGRETDTQDCTGQILREAQVRAGEEAVREAVLSFVGDYDQIPPMYSALKVDGKRLYDLARAGKTVERKARPVRIYEIRIEEVALPRVTMTVHCSKGTYIRTLCHDIGQKLGCGACMESLLRTRVDRFTLEDSLTLAQIETLRDAGKLSERILPIEAVFAGLPALHTDPERDRLARNGNKIPWRTEEEAFPEGARVRLYSSDGSFIGIYEARQEERQFKPVKIFYRA